MKNIQLDLIQDLQSNAICHLNPRSHGSRNRKMSIPEAVVDSSSGCFITSFGFSLLYNGGDIDLPVDIPGSAGNIGKKRRATSCDGPYRLYALRIDRPLQL